jgi:hypothetical protein
MNFDITIISAMIVGFIMGYTVAMIIGVAIIKQLEHEIKDIKRQYLDLAIAITHPVPDGPLKSDWEDVIKMINNESKRK